MLSIRLVLHLDLRLWVSRGRQAACKTMAMTDSFVALAIMLVHGDIHASWNAPTSALLGRLACFGKLEGFSSPSTD